MKPVFLLSALGVALLAISYLLLGMVGIVRKKPILFHGIWFYWLIVLATGPQLINAFLQFYANRFARPEPLILLQLLLYPFVLFSCWKPFQGYFVYGINDNSLRDALHLALNRLNLSHEESVARLRLVSIDADLQVTFQAWLGSAQLRIRPANLRATLRSIADTMRIILTESTQEPPLYAFVYCVCAGFVLAAVDVVWVLYSLRLI